MGASDQGNRASGNLTRNKTRSSSMQPPFLLLFLPFLILPTHNTAGSREQRGWGGDNAAASSLLPPPPPPPPPPPLPRRSRRQYGWGGLPHAAELRGAHGGERTALARGLLCSVVRALRPPQPHSGRSRRSRGRQVAHWEGRRHHPHQARQGVWGARLPFPQSPPPTRQGRRGKTPIHPPTLSFIHPSIYPSIHSPLHSPTHPPSPQPGTVTDYEGPRTKEAFIELATRLSTPSPLRLPTPGNPPSHPPTHPPTHSPYSHPPTHPPSLYKQRLSPPLLAPFPLLGWASCSVT